jgi:hypothetical protein
LRHTLTIEITPRSISARLWVELNRETAHIDAIDALRTDILEILPIYHLRARVWKCKREERKGKGTESTHGTKLIAALKRDVYSGTGLDQLTEEEIADGKAMDTAEECLRQWRAGRSVCAEDGSGGAKNRVACQGATGGEG